VRAGYLALARDEPERFRVVQAGRSVDIVEAEVWEHVQGLMGK
jgi:thymidylate kinase